MCGITGFTGRRNALPVLLGGLKKLEYRGYDSSGVAFFDGGIRVVKRMGGPDGLTSPCERIYSECGIGHTRWATHGEPSVRNAHPQSRGKFALVHNGIIENYLDLKSELKEKGYSFESDTDTEVIVSLFDYYYDGDLLSAANKVKARLKGSYAVALLCADREGEIFAMRSFSPLIVGRDEDGCYLSSDFISLGGTDAVVLGDGESALLSASGVRFYDKDFNETLKKCGKTEVCADAEKGGFGYFMEKEISEIPISVDKAICGFIESGAAEWFSEIKKPKKVILCACGTAYHACIVGKYAIEGTARICSEAVQAGEFRYSDPVIDEDTLVLFVSQSGETADTLSAAKLAKDNGAIVAAVTNVRGSSISRLADKTFYTYSGAEIAVAATKSFNSQVALLYMIAYALARTPLPREFFSLSEKARLSLSVSRAQADALADCAERADGIFFIGRNVDYPIALEGSLKCKEITYRFCEGYSSGELKHGTLALIDSSSLVIAIITRKELKEKTKNAISEVSARGASVAVIACEDCMPEGEFLKNNRVICTLPLPSAGFFSPVISVIPLQYFAFRLAVRLGNDPDKPRNLAKSVTVE